MRMDLGLTQTIKQIQTLSPQMYMSMEILCLNSLDLEERIETELEENVALEIADEAKDSEKEVTQEASAGTESGGGLGEEVATVPEGQREEVPDEFDRKVEGWDRYMRDDFYEPATSRTYSYDDKDEKLEALNNTEGKQRSLQEYLEQQIHLLDRKILGEDPEQVIDLCIAIIYNIDDRGYLMYSLDEIQQSLLEEMKGEEGEAGSQPGVEGSKVPAEGAAPEAQKADAPQPPPGEAQVPSPPRKDDRENFRPLLKRPTPELLQKALSVVQGLDPPGVGGRDLKECLLLQLQRDGQPYVVEMKIIEGHLEDLAKNRLPKIAKTLGISVDEVKVAAETIASLNPLPGKLFGGEAPRFVKPDVMVQEVDGRYEVRVESDYLPRLQVSSYYRDLYKASLKDPELKKFIKKKIESAEWLMSAIRQRQSTLQRIAQEIVEIQKGFLDHGISHLRPLKMVEVAEKVGVHVSTISRAISGKYIQTPRGIFEMKFFFTGGSMKSDGTMEARGSVIQRIKDLIAGEDKRNPLSDIDIVKKLGELDINISRRTVTKYREAENIPSSRQRRSY